MLESEANMNEATQYAEILSKMIQEETISSIENHSSRKFDQFRELLKSFFLHYTVFALCTISGMGLFFVGQERESNRLSYL